MLGGAPASDYAKQADVTTALTEKADAASVYTKTEVDAQLAWRDSAIASKANSTDVDAALAAKAGATFVSPFIGRLDDIGLDGMELIREIRTIYDNYIDLSTDILAASIRTVNHVKEAALIGADVATVPPAILKALVKHPLTDKGIEQFVADWKKTGQTL